MADWEARMMELSEYESTTTNANLMIERDSKGPKYKFEDVCKKYEYTYTYYDA